jgi:HD-like signal output (HDOD) protein
MADPTPESNALREAHLTLDYLLRRMRHKSDFPALSGAVTRVQALSDSETENLQTLCDGILQDVALTHKLLRLVNTARYRRADSDPISTVSRAVSLIGLAGVRNLALSLMLLEHMPDKAHAQQLKEAFLRVVMAGTLASELCTRRDDAEAAFVGALFRNLGPLLVAYYLPDDAEQIGQLTQGGPDGQPPISEEAAARRVLGLGLNQLGVSVGRLWSLPDALLACIVDPGDTVPNLPLAGRPDRVWWLASLANEAADVMLKTEPVDLAPRLQALEARFQVPLEMASGELQAAAGRARRRMSELTDALNMTVPGGSPAERLLDVWYVDAPQGEAGGAGPTPEALGLTETADDGALPASPTEAHDAVSILGSGIQDVTSVLTGPFQLQEVLQVILETMLRALDCRRVLFCLRDPRAAALQGRLALGEGGDVLRNAFRVPLVHARGETPDLFAAVCLRNVDTLIADASAPAVAPRLPTWFRERVQAPTFLLMPLVLKRAGQPDAVLGLIYADKTEANSLVLDEQTLSLLRTLRNQAIMAFRQATGT